MERTLPRSSGTPFGLGRAGAKEPPFPIVRGNSSDSEPTEVSTPHGRRGRPPPRRRRRRRHSMAMRPLEGHDAIGAPFHRPAQLMHRMVMPSAQCEEIGEVRLAAQLPRHHVVDLREVGESAARESATFVSAIDLDALSPRRTSSCSFLVENRSVLSLQREDDLGVAGQATCHFARNRANTRQRRDATRIFAGQEVQIGVHHQGWAKSGRNPSATAGVRAWSRHRTQRPPDTN